MDKQLTYAVTGKHDWRRFAIAVVALSVTALIDLWTGLDIRVDLFYALIVIYLAWYEGAAWAIAAAIASSVMHFVDFSEHFAFGNPRVVAFIWNLGLDLAFYVLITVLVVRIHTLSLQLANRYQEAQQESRLREDLMYVVSHDLKTPLTSILLNAEMIDRTTSPETAACVGRIRRSCQRMTELINELLDFARIREGKLQLELVDLPTVDLLTEIVELRRQVADQKGVTLTVAVSSGVPRVRVDRHRFAQVLSNLVDNAIKFAPESTVVTLSAQRCDDAVCFAIADQGPGIPPEVLPHLFERFWQPRQERQRPGAGTGFGLAIAKGLVDAHQGRIWVESAPGRGTTFFVAVPAIPAPAHANVA